MSQQPQQPYNGHPGMAPTAPGSTILQVHDPQAPPTPQAPPQAAPQAPPTPQVRVTPIPVPQVYGGQQTGLPMVRQQQGGQPGQPNPVAQVGKLFEEHRRDLAAAGMGALLLTLLQRR